MLTVSISLEWCCIDPVIVATFEYELRSIDHGITARTAELQYVKDLFWLISDASATIIYHKRWIICDPNRPTQINNPTIIPSIVNRISGIVIWRNVFHVEHNWDGRTQWNITDSTCPMKARWVISKKRLNAATLIWIN